MAAILSAVTVQEWTDVVRRDNEAEMMFRGQEIARALRRYQKDRGALPNKLDQLREPGSRGQYFIRKLYKDPLVKDGKWGLLSLGPSGGLLDPNTADLDAGQTLGLSTPDTSALDPGGAERVVPTAGAGGAEVTGLPIAGVKSLCTEEPFRVYQEQTEYAKWLFSIFDLQRVPGAEYLTFDKPYTSDSKWGANFAYTYSKGQQQASTDEGYAFGFDSWPPGNWTFFPANGDARHRFIASGTVGLPLGFRASAIVTLASPTVFTYADCNSEPTWDDCVVYLNGWRGTKQSFLGLEEFGYRGVDLRDEWEARLGGDLRQGLVAEAFNVFNYPNYNGFDLWLGGPGETPRAEFGQPTSAYNARRYQFGVRFGF